MFPCSCFSQLFLKDYKKSTHILFAFVLLLLFWGEVEADVFIPGCVAPGMIS